MTLCRPTESRHMISSPGTVTLDQPYILASGTNQRELRTNLRLHHSDIVFECVLPIIHLPSC